MWRDGALPDSRWWFMDTALTRLQGLRPERWKYAAFRDSPLCSWCNYLPRIRELGMGRRLAFRNWAPTSGWAMDTVISAGFGRIHGVGGIPRWPSDDCRSPYRQDTPHGTPNANGLARHRYRPDRLLYSGLRLVWFQPSSTLASIRKRCAAHRLDAVTHASGLHRLVCALLYMWNAIRKATASMTDNGLLAGLVAITAPSGFSARSDRHHRFHRRIARLRQRGIRGAVLKVDDPVGADLRYGTNGLWGVFSVGLFADGTSNYGGSGMASAAPLPGLFLRWGREPVVAQFIGVGTLLRLCVRPLLPGERVIDIIVGQRRALRTNSRAWISRDGCALLSEFRAETRCLRQRQRETA